MAGGILISMASVRVTAAGTPRPVFITRTYTTSFSVTALEGNAGTIYIAASSDGASAASKVRTTKLGIPLTPRQSFTFTGVPFGSSGFRDLSVGTLRLYIDANLDNDRALITYYKQEP